MDLDEVKACLRALLSSTAFSYTLSNLLSDFRNMTGLDLPLFGFYHPVQFLRTLSDTVQLFGDHFNPQIALVESKKSAHITSLVDRQKNNNLRVKYPQIASKQKRLVIPCEDNEVVTNSCNDRVFRFTAIPCNNAKDIKPSQPFFRFTPQLMPPMPLQSLPTTFSLTYSLSKPKTVKLPEVSKNDATALKNLNPKPPEGDSVPREDCKEQVEKSFVEPIKNKKTDSCYFEGECFPPKTLDPHSANNFVYSPDSDLGSLLSPEDYKTSDCVTSSTCCSVNNGIKNKLKKLIKQYPEGLWCCELAELFLKEYNFVLDYREFGYTSLIQMLSELPDVFRCVRPGNEDWILFDASTAPTSTEKKMTDLQSTSDYNCEVRTNIQMLLLTEVESTSESGVKLDEIPELYRKMFGKSLDFKSFGFKDLKSLFETWEGTLVNLLMVDGKTVVAPALKKIRREVRWEEAIPPITEESDIFHEIFPKDVVGPYENLIELDLSHHIVVGHVVKICVAEVWSPSKFYVQLNKYKERLNLFMDELQKFYSIYLNKFKMPDATIRAKQVCVGLYNADPDYPDEWHRAEIVKVINDKTVLVNFVDYGTVTRVKKTQLRFLHRNFQSFPIQAFLAKLSGVVPPNSEKTWPVGCSKKFLEYLRVPNLDAEIVDVDFRKPSMSVVLYDSYQKPETNINKRLVKEKLAKLMDPLPDNLAILQDREQQMRGLGVNSSDLSVDKNLSERTDAFSDIDDSVQPTLLLHKMNALKIEDSLKKIKMEKKSEKLNVTLEFDEVPELENNTGKESAEEKENKPKMFEDEIRSKLAPPPQKKLPTATPVQKPEEKPIVQHPKPKTNPPETSFLPSVDTPKRCPPGLENVSVTSDFSQIPLLLQSEDIKKRINGLALELLSTSPSIKQVGMIDPSLALKIATEMAEAYLRSEYASKLSFEFNPLLANSTLNGFIQPKTNAYEAIRPVMRFMPVIPPVMKLTARTNSVTDSTNTTCTLEENSAKTSPNILKNKTTYVKKVIIGGKTVHLVVINNQFYCGAEEIVQTFALISNREVADRILHMKKIPMIYNVVSKKTNEDAFNAIKSSEMAVVNKKTKKMKFHLISLSMVLPFLQALGCYIRPLEHDVAELLKIENINKLSQLL